MMSSPWPGYPLVFGFTDLSSVFLCTGAVIVKVASAGRKSTPGADMLNVTCSFAEVAPSGTVIASTEAT
jgi:hypothetical protein